MNKLKPCPFCGGEAEFEHSYREDGHRYPRDFWHVRIGCTKCFHETDWEEYGKQENQNNSPEDKAQAETEIASVWNTRPIEDALRDHITELSIELIHMGEEEIVIDALRTDIACLQVALDAAEAERNELEKYVSKLVYTLTDGKMSKPYDIPVITDEVESSYQEYIREAVAETEAENARLQKMVDWLAETNATTCELFLPTNFRSDPEIWKESARQAVTAVEGEENE